MKIEVWTPPEERKEEPVLRLRLRMSDDEEGHVAVIQVDEAGNEQCPICFITPDGISPACASNGCLLPRDRGFRVKVIP